MRLKKLAKFLSITLVLLMTAAGGWESKASMAPEARVQQEPTPEQILAVATIYLKNLPQFSFEAEMVEDVAFGTHQQVQANHRLSYFVKRPNKLRFQVSGDFRNKDWYYDGKQIVAYDREKNLYSQEPFPPSIDAALAKARDELNLRLSIVGIARTDFYEIVTAGVAKSTLVGMSKAAGVPCYQLLLEREPINVQLWIQAGEIPLLRKVVVTDKTEEGWPQWSAEIIKWNIGADLRDSFFEFAPPQGAMKIKFLKQEANLDK